MTGEPLSVEWAKIENEQACRLWRITVLSGSALTRVRQKSLHVTGTAFRAASVGPAQAKPIVVIYECHAPFSVPQDEVALPSWLVGCTLLCGFGHTLDFNGL